VYEQQSDPTVAAGLRGFIGYVLGDGQTLAESVDFTGLPPSILSNDDLSTFLDTSDEWITTRTGMKERRISHVSAVEMATLASARALACAGLDPGDVDLIVYGGCSNEEVVPNSASGVQVTLGATRAAAMDVNTACTSFIYGLSAATAMIQNGTIRNAVVIGVELISRYIDWSNRNVAVLFGDGAAAVVVQATMVGLATKSLKRAKSFLKFGGNWKRVGPSLSAITFAVRRK